MVEAGKQYAGAKNSRRWVRSVDGDDVTYILPISQIEEQCTVAEFDTWKLGEYVNPFPHTEEE